jgi:archaellum component FlaC
MNNEPTIGDVLSAINEFATSVENRFQGIEGKFESIDTKLDGIDKRLNKVEALMVTKDYLDDKLADLRGDLVVLTRKEDAKLITLVGMLTEKNIISVEDAKKIMSMEPFPKLAL